MIQCQCPESEPLDITCIRHNSRYITLITKEEEKEDIIEFNVIVRVMGQTCDQVTD